MNKKNKNEKQKNNVTVPRQQKKAPRVSRTKGYYRFSKDFPSVTDNNGFRDNDVFVTSPAKKAALRKKLSALFISVFLLAFIVTSFAFAVANHPIPLSEETSTEHGLSANVLSGIAYIKGDIFSSSGVESVINRLKSEGINSVALELKDASGYFYYKPTFSVNNEAVSRASDNAASVIATFKSADIKVFACISCYADDIYARNNRDIAAYAVSVPESGGESVETLWYDASPEAHAWLSPYSNTVRYYISEIINDIQSLNVDGIIFDNVLPYSNIDNVIFPGQSDSENDIYDEAAEHIKYINNTVNTYTGVIIPHTVMLKAFEENSAPEIFESGCDYLVPKIILKDIPSGTAIGTRIYSPPSGAPKEFTGDYMKAAFNLTVADEQQTDTSGGTQNNYQSGNTAKIIPFIENSDVFSAQTAALASLGADSYMIYVDSKDIA